jgi:hypothetical protein
MRLHADVCESKVSELKRRGKNLDPLEQKQKKKQPLGMLLGNEIQIPSPTRDRYKRRVRTPGSSVESCPLIRLQLNFLSSTKS